MTVTNHLLAGSLIGLAVGQPELALVLAYISHFAMDAVPHFGFPGIDTFADAVKEAVKHRATYIDIVLSAITFTALIIVMLIKRQYFVMAAGLVAVIPDMILVINYFLYERKGKKMKGPIAAINLKFHGRIQFERFWGIYVEVAAFVILVAVFFKHI